MSETSLPPKFPLSRLVFYAAVVVIFVVAVLVGRQWLVGTGAPTPSSEATPSIPTIGGPFTLVDHDGNTVTDAAFRGRYMLIYFGYTYCPDVCPTALGATGEALDMLGEAGDSIVPLFITVDPQRDTPAALKDYVGHFHPRMVGLTGSAKQIVDVAKAYRVYFAKVVEEGADEDAYLVDHTAITYLMGPDGGFLTHFAHGTTPETMARRIRDYL